MARISQLVWRPAETPEPLHPMLAALEEEYPVVSSGRGVRLKFREIRSAGTVSRVLRSPGEALVEYNSVTAAARGVGSALAGLDGAEETPFRTLGVMIDASRNMVPTVDHLKMWFRRLALAGCNLVMLYTEDVYELPDEPFFGYMRGGYTADDLRELDRYAARLGIELVGCIQTLGHLEQILRWDGSYRKIADTQRVLATDEPATYELIGKMIRFWSGVLASRRIHIGLDETHDLGRGRVLDRNGFTPPFELFNRHLAKVNAICRENGLSPMLWSDMYFRLANPEQDYYDLTHPVPTEVCAKIPPDVSLVYWDYYHTDADLYSKMIRRHRDIGFEPVMASGIWTWGTPWYDHALTRRAVVPCIEACRREKVAELFFTMWGDDGGYCDFDSALAGVFFASDLAYGAPPEEAGRTAKRFAAICGGDYGAHLLASEMLEFQSSHRRCQINPMLAVWDDPLLGLYTDNLRRRDPESDLLAAGHFNELQNRLLPHWEERAAGNFELALALLEAAARKLELRGALTAAYDRDDRTALRRIAERLVPAAVAAVRNFDAKFRRRWLEGAAPFGLETIQIRNAGAVARLEECARRILSYLDGEISRIAELESRAPADAPVHTMNWYPHMATGTVIR